MPVTEKSKIFVLDTNVILHDHQCLKSFKEHDIVIPIEVLSEIDKFKSGLEIINLNARGFTRFIDELPDDLLFDGGAPLGEGLGKVKVIMNIDYSEKLKVNFSEEIVDHKILNVAFYLSNLSENTDKEVVLVSKDINLRVKAKFVKVKTEDYKADAVPDISAFEKDVRSIALGDDLFANLRSNSILSQDELPEVSLGENEFVKIRSGSEKSTLAMFQDKKLHIMQKAHLDSFGVSSKNAEQAFALKALLDPTIKLVTILGKAGTGKTIIALAAGLGLIEKKEFNTLYFTRQTISMGNVDIGFLPGDIKDKISPFMQGLKDNLTVIKNINKRSKESSKIDAWEMDETILIKALAFIRGSSMVNTYFIVDEAQNCTPKEIKTIVTRAGEGTKFVFLGDVGQIDHPYLDSRTNGLSYLIDKMKGQRLYAHINFMKGERSELANLAGELLK